MAYKVYAGRINRKTPEAEADYLVDPLTGEGNVEYLYWTRKELIYPNENYSIYDMKLSCTNEEVSTFEFTMPKFLFDACNGQRENAIYDDLKVDYTVIMIIEDDAILWMGGVEEIELNFDLSKKVTCYDPLYGRRFVEGMIPANCDWKLKRVFDNCIKNTNSPGYGTPIRLLPGKLSVHQDDQIDIDKKDSTITNQWSILQTYLLNEYDGYLRLRYLSNSDMSHFRVVVDYLSDVDVQTEQCVKYGENMLDLTVVDALDDDFCTGVYVYGYATKQSGWWIWKKTTTELVVGAALAPTQSILKYGLRVHTLTDDNATSESALYEIAKKELAKYKQELTPTVTVKAFDLCDTGQATDHLGFLKKTRIVSELHGIDEWMVCTKAVLPLDKPDQKEFTFGRTPEKLTTQQNRNTNASEQASLSLKGLISYTQSKQS